MLPSNLARIISYANDNFLAKMPVPHDRDDDSVELIPGSAKSDIIAFLYSDTKLSFKPKEFEKHLDLPYGTITTVLTRLHNEGLIGKTTNSQYHALEHREDLRRYVANLDQLKRMFETLDKDYEEHTNIEGDPSTDIDEAELNAIIDDLEDEIDDSMGGTDV